MDENEDIEGSFIVKRNCELLEYEKNMLQEMNDKATLFIGARGLSFNSVIEFLLNMYANEHSLCLVINASPKETSVFYERIQTKSGNKKIKEFNTERTYRRQEEYLKGGVFFVSSRCLITDFINEKIPVDKISTIFVFNAHQVYENSLEAFLLFLFKEKNKLGLVKAFTNKPLKMSNSLFDTVDYLQCRYINLFPRFRENVKESVTDLEYGEIEIKQTEEIKTLSLLAVQLLDAVLKNENQNLYKDKRPKYKDAFLYRKWRRSENVNNFLTLIALIFNADPTTVFLFYKRMFELQKQRQGADLWILTEESNILYSELEKYAGEIEDEEVFNNFICTQVQNDINENIKLNQPNQEENNIEEDVDYQIDQSFLQNPKLKKLNTFVRDLNTRTIVILTPNRVVREVVKNIFTDMKNVFVVSHFCFEFFRESFGTVILLNNNLGSIRFLEVLKSKRKKFFDVFVFSYRDSIETEIFYSELNAETEKFKDLIQEKQTMPLGERLKRIEIEEDEGEAENLEIIVDSRETRATLPFVLYKANNIVKLELLQVGDYEFTVGEKKILIERKSLSDFISSTNSDRLYLQIKNMSKNCDVYILLIEFPKNELPAFYAYEKYNVYGQTIGSKKSLVLKLCSLVFAFPKLKIIWSNSDINAATYIRDIQNKKSVLLEDDCEEASENEFRDVLTMIPGINVPVYNKIIAKYKNIRELAQTTLLDLCLCVGNETGTKIYAFLNQEF